MNLVKILSIYMLISCTTAEIQHIRFYTSSSSCNSLPNTTIHQSLNNVNGNTFSSMSLLGMWQIWSCPSTNFNCGSVVTTYVINQTPTNTPFCLGRFPNVLYNFKMMGDASQTAPELYLYSSKEFSGHQVKVTKAASWTSSPSSDSFSLQSFWFTGRNEWAIFSEMDFKGSKTCLKPFPQVGSQGWGFSYNNTIQQSNGISIKSAKYGCNHGPPQIHDGPSILIFCISCILISFNS